jgi:hypothetical protein
MHYYLKNVNINYIKFRNQKDSIVLARTTITHAYLRIKKTALSWPDPPTLLIQQSKRQHCLGGDLLSQHPRGVVPSALMGLTSVFGMDTGVPPSHRPPRQYCLCFEKNFGNETIKLT